MGYALGCCETEKGKRMGTGGVLLARLWRVVVGMDSGIPWGTCLAGTSRVKMPSHSEGRTQPVSQASAPNDQLPALDFDVPAL